MNQQINTRKNEIRKTTSVPGQMLNMYLASNLVRKWFEEIADEKDGEIVTIERSEIIARQGTMITPDILSRISFHMQAGDISEVEISNQQRAAKMVSFSGLTPWSVRAQFGKAKYRFLLYANSVEMALEVVKDFIELNYDEPFFIINVQNFEDCIIIKDEEETEQDQEEETDEPKPEKKFYKIEVTVKLEESGSYTSTFVTHTIDVDSAMLKIHMWLHDSMRKRASERGDAFAENFETAIETAVVIPCTRTIEKEFSLAYIKNE